MPEISIHHPTATHLGAWHNFWVPLLLGGGLLFIDFYLIPGIFALPVLLLILLIFLAFLLPSRVVAAWGIAYAVLILTILLLPVRAGGINPSLTDPAIRPYIRTAIFLVGAIGAILLAAYRQRLEAGHEALFRIVSGLPLPVIVSDISGAILFTNEQAQQVLKNHIKELAGLSYFSTFASPGNPGDARSAYIGYFDAGHVGTVATVLQTCGTPILSLHAAITVVAIGKHRYAITVVERVEHVPEQA